MNAARRIVFGLPVFLLWSAIGCGGLADAPSGEAPASHAPAAEGEGVDKDPPVATVNSQPIRATELNDLLMKAYGHDALLQIIASTVVQQEARRQGIGITSADIETETAQTLKEMNQQLDPKQQEVVLRQLLKREKLPMVFWEMTMRRNAVLRKIAAKRMEIDDEQLTAAYNRQYGLKVVVRHIQCASETDAQTILDRLAKGEDFVELAQKYSTNTATAAQGGLLAPFSRDDTDTVPPAFLTAAFDLTDGQVGGIVKVDKGFHVLRREKSIPPKQVAFAEVKQELRRQLAVVYFQRMRERLLNELYNKADKQFLHPVLKQQQRERATNRRLE